MQCFVYRSRRKPGAYLFVADKAVLFELPDELMTVFGQPESSFEFDLTPDRSLVRGDAKTVIRTIEEQGYFVYLGEESLDEVTPD